MWEPGPAGSCSDSRCHDVPIVVRPGAERDFRESPSSLGGHLAKGPLVTGRSLSHGWRLGEYAGGQAAQARRRAGPGKRAVDGDGGSRDKGRAGRRGRERLRADVQGGCPRGRHVDRRLRVATCRERVVPRALHSSPERKPITVAWVVVKRPVGASNSDSPRPGGAASDPDSQEDIRRKPAGHIRTRYGTG